MWTIGNEPWKPERVSYSVLKFHELTVYKRFKTGPEFLPTLIILLHCQFIADVVSGINVAPHSESK